MGTIRVPTATETHRLLCVKEAAAHLGVCERTVLRLVRSGAIPAIRVGRLWRIAPAALRPPQAAVVRLA